MISKGVRFLIRNQSVAIRVAWPVKMEVVALVEMALTDFTAATRFAWLECKNISSSFIYYCDCSRCREILRLNRLSDISSDVVVAEEKTQLKSISSSVPSLKFALSVSDWIPKIYEASLVFLSLIENRLKLRIVNFVT